MRAVYGPFIAAPAGSGRFKRVEEVTGLSQPAANALTNAMEEAAVLREMTGKKTYRVLRRQ